MTSFVLIAILLLIAAVAIVVVPLLRKGSGNPAVWAAFGAVGVLVFGAAGLYVTWSNWNWQQPVADAGTPENMVSRLARRLEKNPNDLDGWLRLGRSYAVLEQYPLSVRAYQRASELAGGRNAEALVGMGEALVLNDREELMGRGGRFIEQGLALDPKNGSALFYGAAVALRKNDLPLARERFAGLLALDPAPTDDVRQIIENQIAAIDERLATSPSEAPRQADARTAGPQGSAPPDNRAQADNSRRTAPAAPGNVPPVKVRVTLSAKLSGESLSSYPLFVLVRDPRRAGPPLAVKRLQATFPQSVELTTADSMLPDHSFAKGQLVEVVARISKTGSPTASPGDPVGLAAHTVGQGGTVDIQIEHVSP
jgi:cytochrome c-type biogenesis protein CcmH